MDFLNNWSSQPTTSFSAAQVILPPLATLAGFGHGAAIGAILSLDSTLSGDQLGGLVLTAGTGFGLGAAYLSRQYETETWDVTMTSLGWLWGLWYAGWSISLSNSDQVWLPLAAVLTADLGAVATAYMISPEGANIAPQVIGWASLVDCASALSVLLTGRHIRRNQST